MFIKTSRLIFYFLFFGDLAAAQAPVANFKAITPVSGCASLAVTFTDISTGNPKYWNWDFGNGQLSNVQNPSVVYSAAGVYTVKLVVRNESGTDGMTKTNLITVNSSPKVQFTSNLTTACLPSTIQFTDQTVSPSESITSWNWDFGDGNKSSAQNPTHIYTAAGFYTVALRVTSSSGCNGSGSKFRFIRILSGVKANFTNTPSQNCSSPFPVTFKNQTSGPGVLSYSWNLGNGINSTNPNPSTVYNTSGIFPIKLIAQSNFGCADTIERNLQLTGVTTNFRSADTACVNSPISFQNSSGEIPISANWDFGDGNQFLGLDASNTFSRAGVYIVKMVNRYENCSDSISRQITIFDSPSVIFSADKVISCKAPLSVNFQDQTPNAVKWLWNFGDGSSSTENNPSHQYTNTGEFDVTVTVTNKTGCSNTVTKSKYIRILKPVVDISNAPSGGCIPFRFSPRPAVKAIDGVVSYFWEFGDGSSSNAVNPVYTYSNVGSYSLKLTITTTGGCIDSIVIGNGVRTGTLPTVDFTAKPTTVCAFDAVSFSAISDKATEFIWNFGDGKSSTKKNPNHSYSDTGHFQVKLTALNNGCPNSKTVPQLISVLPPVPNFGMEINCSNKKTVAFFDSSKTDANMGSIVYLWEFGEGMATSTEENPSFTYSKFGTYLVKLTVTNGTCSNTITKELKLFSETADFSLNKNPVCRTDVFTLSAINSNPQNIKSYVWTVGDRGTFTGKRIVDFRLYNNGTHDIALTIIDSNGCSDTKLMPKLINIIGPTANFNPEISGGCQDKIVNFKDSSTSNTKIVKWTYDFGDGILQSFTSQPFTHQFRDTGLYTIKLKVEDASGCLDTATVVDAVTITNPRASFSSVQTNYCPGLPVQFKDSSSGIGISHQWDFGDQTISTDSNPVHSYSSEDKLYTVRLKIRDSVGCEDSLTRTNYIAIKSPKAIFEIADTTTICPPLETKFTFKGENFESFYWDFGDGSDISTLSDPSHFYNSYGIFTPKLFLQGYGSCFDSIFGKVIVTDARNTIINYDPIKACNQLTVNFNISPPQYTNFTFNFGDGIVDSSNTYSFSHLYSSPNFYSPHLTLEDNTGCQAIVRGKNAIRVIGAQPFFGIDKKEFCDTGSVFFTNYTIGNDKVVGYNWDFGDNSSSTTSDPSHIYPQAGTYVPSLRVNTESGCSNSITDTIRIYRTPVATIGTNDTICLNIPLTFKGKLLHQDTTTVEWNWAFSDGQTSSLRDPTLTFNRIGNYNIKLDTKVAFGCSSSTMRDVYISPPPTIKINGDPVVMSGSGAIIPATYTGSIEVYKWIPALNLGCTNCPNPIATPKSTTKYTVLVTDIYGCTSSSDVTVFVICSDKNVFLPNTFSPNGDGANDRFYPRGTGLVRVQSLRIFNRWGEKVYEKKNFIANDQGEGWDGTYKGKKADADVYVYSIEVICENSEIFTFKGNVMLLK